MKTPLRPKSPAESEATMTQIILPSDANPLNAAFGGRVLEWIDICGAISAQRHCRYTVVTASLDELHFLTPIRVGWTVTLKARVIAAFKTSMEVGVAVIAEDPFTGARHLTTRALLTFVARDASGGRVLVPPLDLRTEPEKAALAEAHSRRDERLSRRGKREAWLELLDVPPDREEE
ncbi:MAG: acyl-CoA thioesterase [Myxococcaceae bacterium]